MTVFARIARFLPTLTCAGLLAVAPSAHADWNWGWGKSVKGSGVVKSEARNVSGFTQISLSIPASTEVIQGGTEGVTLEGDDNILPLIETVVEDGRLKIRFTEKNMSVSTKLLKVVVNAKTVEALSVAGSWRGGGHGS